MSRTHRRCALALAIVWSWIVAGIFMASVIWPDSLGESRDLPIRGAVGVHWAPLDR